MLEKSKAYSGFAVNDMQQAQKFYAETLGIKTTMRSERDGLMTLHLAGDRDTLVYLKPDLEPANYTILNFEVDDIDAAVEELASRGVNFKQYEGFDQDEKGIFNGGAEGDSAGPRLAWFEDPSGNILSLLQEVEEGAAGSNHV